MAAINALNGTYRMRVSTFLFGFCGVNFTDYVSCVMNLLLCFLNDRVVINH